MKDRIIRLKFATNRDFYIGLICELGLLRKRNECAICFKKIDIKNYNIQICKKCRKKYLKIINHDINNFNFKTIIKENNKHYHIM